MLSVPLMHTPQLQYWTMAPEAELVHLLFPDVSFGEQPASQSALVANVSTEQRDAFQRVLDNDAGILNVVVVDSADGVDRMATSWPWAEAAAATLPFAGIALTPSLLPCTHPRSSSLSLRCV